MANHSEIFFTTVTVGKRGQIVIPAKLRKELSIDPEEQLVVMSGPHHQGFVVMKTDSFMKRQEQFKKIQKELFQ